MIRIRPEGDTQVIRRRVRALGNPSRFALRVVAGGPGAWLIAPEAIYRADYASPQPFLEEQAPQGIRPLLREDLTITRHPTLGGA
jgi:hypothetical protein